MTPKAVPTHVLSDAETGVPHEVIAVADRRHAARLYELGLGEGTQVTVVKGGDPSIVHIGSGTFALAKELLGLVTVACTAKTPAR